MADHAGATETAVIVPVAAAEPVVAKHRRRLDLAASWGVPAHVTVLYPFVPPSTVDGVLLSRLGAALASVQAFDCTFARCCWFGDDVLWLDPEPRQPFRDLTRAVWRAFPDHPPYRGAFDQVVPHLSVGERRAGTESDLGAAEAAIGPLLPITARIDRAVLMAGAACPTRGGR